MRTDITPGHVFVTGTDTGVGKTHVSVHLIQQWVAAGLRVVAMKPVASGCDWIDGRWQNEDVAKLRAASNVDAPLEWVNPYCFDPPIAPHIAAAQAHVQIDLAVIVHAFQQLSRLADVVVVEGAGGLLVPLNDRQTIADLIQSLNLPALLVVGMKLGCINHALLTAAVMQQQRIPMAGWIANHVDAQMQVQSENLRTLQACLGLPPGLVLPFQADGL